ncbi:MAG: immunoglobulin domain-containing protein [Ignavibacteria bacterium]|nr:immunoglobulin domain-containing protein [Ignavibacteria bacterium]
MKLVYSIGILLIATCVSALGIPKPKVFVKNDGRWQSNILYAAATPNAIMWITTTGMMVDQRVKDNNGIVQSSVVQFDVVGSKGSSKIVTTKTTSPTVSILSSNGTPSPLQTANSVTVQNVLAGINIEYVFDGDNVRYNIHARPGIKIPNPVFNVSGDAQVRSTANGIQCVTPLGDVNMSGIVSFQSEFLNAKKTTWSTHENRFGFDVAMVNSRLPLTIDPIVSVVGIHGGMDEAITSMKLNKQGNLVVAGWTTSFDFITPNGGVNTKGGAGTDGFVAVVSADLSTVLSWTYIAGDSNEIVRAIALNSKGEVWVVGETNSKNISVKGTTIYQTPGSGKDGFVMLLSSDLSTQIAGMYMAGDKDDFPTGVIVNATDQAVVVGSTFSTTGLPTITGYDNTPNGLADAFVMVLHAKMLNCTYFTYFGGANNDSFSKVDLDKNANIVLCGNTSSNNIPTWPEKKLVFVPGDGGKGSVDQWVETGDNPFDVDNNGGESDVMVVKFSNIGELVYSTYFGGKGADVAVDLFVDDDGNAFVVGNTRSNNLPVPLTSTSLYSGGWDGFVCVMSSDGLRLRGAAYLGGADDDQITALVKDAGSVGVVVGNTKSFDFPTIGVGSTLVPAGEVDGFLARLSADDVKNATYFGWAGNDFPLTLVRDNRGDVLIGGNSESNIPGSPQTKATDAFVAKWAYGTLQYNGPAVADPLCRGKAVSVRWTTSDIPAADPSFVDFSIDNGMTWTVIASDVKSKSFSYTLPVDLPKDAQCKFRVRSIHGHVATSPGTLNTLSAPEVTTAPRSVASCPNGKIALSVVASGSSITYQWRKELLPIAGATAAEYSIASAQTTDAGLYDVVITNGCASTTTQAVSVVVTSQPTITLQPASQSVMEGVTITLQVEAMGQDLTYQWQKDGVPLQGPEYKMAVVTILNPTAADAGKYNCVIGSACGSTTSNEASVVIMPTGVDEDRIGSDNTLSVYPQPARDAIAITMPSSAATGLLLISDSQGAEILRKSLTATSSNYAVEIAIGHLATGTYSVRLINGGKTFSTMFNVVR